MNKNRFNNYLEIPLRFGRPFQNKNIIKTNCHNNSTTTLNPKSMVSWNIQGIIFFTNQSKIRHIINKLKEIDADIICLQEVFEDSIKDEIVSELSSIYPYYLLGDTTKKYILCEDSGLLILSKMNIVFEKEIHLEGCKRFDRFSNKSMVYFKVGEYNFVTTHLQSSNNNITSIQLQDIINKSPFQNFIIVGDLNHPDAHSIINTENNNKENTYKNSILDYIIPIQYNNIQLDIKVLNFDISQMTDHLPIYSKFSFNQ